MVSRISAATNEEDAQEILFAHLSCNADVDTLREYCEVIIAANGFPKMQSFGRNMKELQQGGWLSVFVCVCTACMCVCVYVRACACYIYVTLFHATTTSLCQIHASCINIDINADASYTTRQRHCQVISESPRGE